MINNKKGQDELFIGGGVVILILLAFLGGMLIGPYITGGVIEDCNCDFVTREAQYITKGKTTFEGSGFTDGKFNVKLKNEEEQAAKFRINMECNTASDSKIINSDYLYVQPKTVQEFSITYKVGFLENWKCVLSSVDSETINSCEAI